MPVLTTRRPAPSGAHPRLRRLRARIRIARTGSSQVDCEGRIGRAGGGEHLRDSLQWRRRRAPMGHLRRPRRASWGPVDLLPVHRSRERARKGSNGYFGSSLSSSAGTYAVGTRPARNRGADCRRGHKSLTQRLAPACQSGLSPGRALRAIRASTPTRSSPPTIDERSGPPSPAGTGRSCRGSVRQSATGPHGHPACHTYALVVRGGRGGADWPGSATYLDHRASFR